MFALALVACSPGKEGSIAAWDDGAEDTAGTRDTDTGTDTAAVVSGLLEVSPSVVDLGEVLVGCEGATTLTLANVGSGLLGIEEVSLAEGTALTMTRDGGQLPLLPWTVRPDAAIDLELGWAPASAGSLAEVVRVRSDEANGADIEVPVVGEARVEHAETLTVVVEPKRAVTALLALNESIATGVHSAAFTAALPVLFDVLRASGAPYRLAFLVTTTGEVTGQTPYLDASVETTDAVAIVAGMLAEPSADGDNDYLFPTLAAGVEANRAWLLDESDTWTAAKLSLVGMNDDLEQSEGNHVVWVNEFRTYKADPADVVVHGIGGGVSPRECEDVPPLYAFLDAAAMTGGVFLSLCEGDWEARLRTLAAALLDPQRFPLADAPLRWTLEVTVDGVAWTEGWAYDASLAEVIFDTESAPPVGAVVEITYVTAPECP